MIRMSRIIVIHFILSVYITSGLIFKPSSYIKSLTSTKEPSPILIRNYSSYSNVSDIISIPNQTYKDTPKMNTQRNKTSILYRSFGLTLSSTNSDASIFYTKYGDFAIWTSICLSILGTIGFDIIPILSLLSIITITIAVASIDVLRNYVANMVLAYFKSIKVGDYITLGSYKGKVISIDTLHIRLLSKVNSSEVLIPLSMFYSNPVIVEKNNTPLS
jgi:small-conductance mechanosensitive channel